MLDSFILCILALLSMEIYVLLLSRMLSVVIEIYAMFILCILSVVYLAKTHTSNLVTELWNV